MVVVYYKSNFLVFPSFDFQDNGSSKEPQCRSKSCSMYSNRPFKCLYKELMEGNKVAIIFKYM
jgi:hypothetical protein